MKYVTSNGNAVIRNRLCIVAQTLNCPGRIDYEEFLDWCMGDDSAWDDARRSVIAKGSLSQTAKL
eukprot:5876915-Amphidinium_carterae.2